MIARRTALAGLVAALGALAGWNFWPGRSIDAERLQRLGTPRDISWSDLVPDAARSAMTRSLDGAPATGVVGHGDILGRNGEPLSSTSFDPPGLAAQLGAVGDLRSPPRRVSDAFGGLGNLRALQPRGGALQEQMDGQTIRLSGFVAPLTFESGRMSEFLLVPYVGACIHVPPPSSNQIVHVADPGDYRPDQGLLYPVTVTGRLRVLRAETELAEAGYRLDDAVVEKFSP